MVIAHASFSGSCLLVATTVPAEGGGAATQCVYEWYGDTENVWVIVWIQLYENVWVIVWVIVWVW